MWKQSIAVLVAATALLGQSSSPVPAAPGVSVSGTVLNLAAMEPYFRHLLMWPASVNITFGDPESAPLPGFVKVEIKGTLGGRSETAPFYVSTDGQTVIRGEMYDVRKNPFQSEVDLLKTDNQPFLGEPGAPVKVVVFGDFQCPYCRQESSVLRTELMQAFPSDVQLTYMDYPIDERHPFARGAAVLGRCIFDQNNDSFWKYHDWIFEHQSDLTPANLREKGLEYAKGDPKLDQTKLTSCADSPEPRAEVDRTVAIGDALKLSATPTIFINGRRLVGTIPLEDLKMVVEHEIAWAKSQKKDNDCCSIQLSLPGMPAKKPQ